MTTHAPTKWATQLEIQKLFLDLACSYRREAMLPTRGRRCPNLDEQEGNGEADDRSDLCLNGSSVHSMEC